MHLYCSLGQRRFNCVIFGLLGCALMLSPLALAVQTPDSKREDPKGTPDIGPVLEQARGFWAKGDAAGQAAEREREFDARLKLLQEQDQAYQACEEIFRKALKASPQHTFGWFEYGRFLYERKQYGSAGRSLMLALNCAGGSIEEPLPEKSELVRLMTAQDRADLFRLLGGVLERAGKLPMAVRMYECAMKLDERDQRNRISLGIAQATLGRFEDALQTLRAFGKPEVEHFCPNELQRALGVYTLAYAHELSGMPEEAFQLYKAVQEFAARSPKVDSYGIGEEAKLARNRLRFTIKQFESPKERQQYYLAIGLYEQARKTKEQLDKDGNLEKALSAWADARDYETKRLLRAREPLKSFFEVRDELLQVLKTYPQMARAHRDLGEYALKLGLLEDAQTYYEAAIAYDPLSVILLYSLGHVRFVLDDWEGALEPLQKLLSVDPEFGPGQLQYAMTLLRLRRNAADLENAEDALYRAEKLGVASLALQTERKILDELRVVQERGESMPPVARKRKIARYTPTAENLDPFRNYSPAWQD